MKVCCTCQIEKPLEDFGNLTRRASGKHSNYKKCRQSYEKKRRDLKHSQGLCVNSSCKNLVDPNGDMICECCKADRKSKDIIKKSKHICKQCKEPVLIEGMLCCKYHTVYYCLKNATRKPPSKSDTDKMIERFESNPFCPYSGERLFLSQNAELDHKNPQSSHPEQREDLENLQWVSKLANRSKAYMTHDEYLNFCLKVVKHNNLVYTEGEQLKTAYFPARRVKRTMMTNEVITRQAALNRVFDYFIIQKNPPGYDYELNNCVYRSGELKCAIGCLLPDDKVEYLIEETDFTSQQEVIKDLFEDSHTDFWKELQSAHDFAAMTFQNRGTKLASNFRQTFLHRLIKLAKDYKLKLPAIQ